MVACCMHAACLRFCLTVRMSAISFGDPSFPPHIGCRGGVFTLQGSGKLNLALIRSNVGFLHLIRSLEAGSAEGHYFTPAPGCKGSKGKAEA
jgi:hypothetical protein